MSNDQKIIDSNLEKEYEYGFVTDIESETLPPGLDENVIRTISKKKVQITMSLTTPGCSMGQHMADDIKSKVSKLEEIETVDVDITFDPPWNPNMMTDEARKKIGFDTVTSTKNTQEIETEWD